MAYFPPFNGNSQPVFALDINNGSQTGTISAAALVQPQGPKLDFFAVVVKNAAGQARDLRAQLGSYSSGVFNPGAVVQINQAIQRTTTIAIYQVEGDTSGQISYAIYPQAAYTAATLEAVVQGLGTITVTNSDGTTSTLDVSGSTVTNTGFQLSLS